MIAKKSSFLNCKQLAVTTFCICFVVVFTGYSQEKKELLKLKELGDTYIQTANKLKYKNPDSAIVLYKKSYENYYTSKHFKEAISSLSNLGLVYENNANYAYSYAVLWDALMIADDLENHYLKGIIYGRLGRIYSYYKREKESLDYLNKSLDIQKELIRKNKFDKSTLVPYYFALTSTSREWGKHEMGEKYLDSCFMYHEMGKEDIAAAYLNFEKGYFISKRKNYQEALDVFKSIEPWFLENEPSYLVLIYKYWGDIYMDLSQLDKGKSYYTKSLEVSKTYNSHVDFTPLVYEALVDLEVSKQNFKQAFVYQKKAKDLDARFFDSRSVNNQGHLEIKDQFRLEKERQENIIQAQHLKELEQEEKIYNLKILLLSIGIISVLVIAFIFFKTLRSRHKAEKLLIRKTKQLEIQKTEELLELKNKELALSALQLIEKDEFLRTLKSKVRGDNESLKTHEVNKVLRSISLSNNQSWEEFKLRFIEVNESFYKVISEKFPNLSQNDQKMCALIKLNFSSKETARLLGISPESVHTKRYRLRKKMGLDQGVNLEDYIGSL